MHNHLHFKDTALKTREWLNNSWELLTPQHFRVPVAGIYCVQPSQTKTLTHPVYLDGFLFCFQMRKYATLELSYTQMHSLCRQLLRNRRENTWSALREHSYQYFTVNPNTFLVCRYMSCASQVLIVTVNFFWPAHCCETHTLDTQEVCGRPLERGLKSYFTNWAAKIVKKNRKYGPKEVMHCIFCYSKYCIDSCKTPTCELSLILAAWKVLSGILCKGLHNILCVFSPLVGVKEKMTQF